MKNKIAILTTPLFYNYGGILQCYALLTTLRSEGYDASVIDIQYKKNNKWDITKSVIKAIVKKFILRQKNVVLYNTALSEKNKAIIRQNIIPFIQNNIKPKTPPIYGTQYLKDNPHISDFDIFIVGSDQVWRPMYSDIYTYFLGFVEGKGHKKISYAASFGVDKWEYSDEKTKLAADLIRGFSAVSVREDSGIELCKKYLNTDAIRVLDPTMLLKKEDYLKLIYEQKKQERGMMVYILDINKKKRGIINKVSTLSGYQEFNVNNQNTEKEYKSARERVVPSIENWLCGFRDCKFVITDSFHGTVFSILFNVPFLVYGNQERGLSRFLSLLKIFGLQNRLISDEKHITEELINESIDWQEVNTILVKQREASTAFLTNSLNS